MKGIALPAEAAARTDQHCHLCGSPLTAVGADAETPSSPTRSEWPAGIDPLALPTHLAIPFERYLAEPNPRARLHWLVDTTARWPSA